MIEKKYIISIQILLFVIALALILNGVAFYYAFIKDGEYYDYSIKKNMNLMRSDLKNIRSELDYIEDELSYIRNDGIGQKQR